MTPNHLSHTDQGGEEILAHATTWMNLGSIMVGEISQSQKDKYEVPSVVKFIETQDRMVLDKGLREEARQVGV